MNSLSFMEYTFLKAVKWPIVVNFFVIWSLVESIIVSLEVIPHLLFLHYSGFWRYFKRWAKIFSFHWQLSKGLYVELVKIMKLSIQGINNFPSTVAYLYQFHYWPWDLFALVLFLRREINVPRHWRASGRNKFICIICMLLKSLTMTWYY